MLIPRRLLLRLRKTLVVTVRHVQPSLCRHTICPCLTHFQEGALRIEILGRALERRSPDCWIVFTGISGTSLGCYSLRRQTIEGLHAGPPKRQGSRPK